MREVFNRFVVRGSLSEVFHGLFVADAFEQRMRCYANVEVGPWLELVRRDEVQRDEVRRDEVRRDEVQRDEVQRDIVLRLPANNPIAVLLRTDRAGATIRQVKRCPEPACIVVTCSVVPLTLSERHVRVDPTVVLRQGKRTEGASEVPVVDVHISTVVSVTLPQPAGFFFGRILESLLVAFCSRVNGVFREFGTALSVPKATTI